tara:strand:+ start:383 stop:619 length:237 start_codon:yes stop_codon:yes gene_type:complete
MVQWIKNLISLWGLHNDSRWFEKNPAAQMRFEDVEDWIEELEERVIDLEAIAHPKCGIESFDGYQQLVERISKLENDR